MRVNISNRDYEILSAYIDGQLTPGEQNKLEERLRARNELQVALDEMRRTRALLRQAPRRRAPRNFTLTPAMVGETKRRSSPTWNWFPVLSFTSALAALALVAVIVLQFAPGPSASPADTIAMQPAAGQMESAAPEMRAMEDAPEEPQAGEAQLKMAEENPSAQTEEAGAMMMAEPAAESPAAESSAAEAQAPEAPAAPMAEAPAPGAEESTADQPPAGEPPAVAAEAQPNPDTTLQTAPGMSAESAPPIIVWNDGYFGGRGMGGGGMGGGMDGGSIQLPQESVDALKEAPASDAPDAAAAGEVGPTPEPTAETEPTQEPREFAPLSGAGPILGVPAAGEGGQIVERRAMLANPDDLSAEAIEGNPAAAGDAGLIENEGRAETEGFTARQEGSAPAAESTAAENGSDRVLGLAPAALLALQVLLAALAAGAGVAAYLVFRQRQH